MNRIVHTREDNPSTKESVIQDKMLNEVIQENTKIMSEQVHIISNFPIYLLSVYTIYDCIIDILYFHPNRIWLYYWYFIFSPEHDIVEEYDGNQMVDSMNKDTKGESSNENEKKKKWAKHQIRKNIRHQCWDQLGIEEYLLGT
jgi:hypothetical protein